MHYPSIHQRARRAACTLALLMLIVLTALLAPPLAEPLRYTPLVSPALAQDTVDDLIAPDETELETPDLVDVQPRAADEEIEQRLRDILVSTNWFVEPQVDVREGVVFLNGRTQREEYREWAANLARRTQDVVAVVNRIEVTPPSAWRLAQNELLDVWRGTVRSLPTLLLAGILFVITWYVARFVARFARRLMRSRIGSPLLRDVIARAVAVPVLLLAVYIVLQVAGLTRLALTVLGGTGVIGIVIGFAFRDIAENFLASLLISVRNPFRADDLIEVAGYKGIVRQVTSRSTVLMTLDGNHIQIPNATIFKSTIVNFTANPNRRGDFTVGIGYDATIAEAQSVVAGVLANHPAVLERPESLVLVDELGSSSVVLHIYYWFNGAEYDPRKIKSALIRLTKRSLEEGGFSMPDEAREVIFPQGVPIVEAGNRAPQTASNGQAPAAGPALPLPSKPAILASGGEGGLSNEDDEIREQARQSPLPEEGEDLLASD